MKEQMKAEKVIIKEFALNSEYLDFRYELSEDTSSFSSCMAKVVIFIRSKVDSKQTNFVKSCRFVERKPVDDEVKTLSSHF